VLGRLLERVEALERENQKWLAETARLACELERLKASGAGACDGGGRLPVYDLDHGGDVSRRGMLRLGAAAVAGAGAVAAGGLVGAQPAQAGTDGDLALGSQSNSASAPTGLEVVFTGGTGATYGIGVTDNGLNAYPGSVLQAALFGHAHVNSFVTGVAGYSNRGGDGVWGVSENPGGQLGKGVYGRGSPGVQGECPGDAGAAAPGPGVTGNGNPGVWGAAIATGTGARGTIDGTINSLGKNVPASGIGVLAEASGLVGGPPAANSIALSATNAGKGTGVKATSASGTPIVGVITNAANAAPAVNGTTNGSGPAVRGTQSGGTGSALYGQISSAKNVSPAVRGAGSSSGRGGMFSGGAAQLRLVPGASVPASGQTGDLFVDSAGHLHYCKAGGSTATWVKLA
jgi:hypothetical protein